MLLSGLTDFLRQNASFQDLLQALRSQAAGTTSFPTLRAARPLLLAALARDWPGPILYLTAQGRRTHNVAEQLPVWLSEGDDARILRYAEPTPMFYDRLAWDRGVIRDRLEALRALLRDEDAQHSPILVAPARALMQRTLSPAAFRQHIQTLRRGDRFTLEKLLTRWLTLGYEPVTMVTEPGTFARRGGIVDIYPLGVNWPLRIEFFGDEIDTLRTFDPATQRTSGEVATCEVMPAREVLPEALPQVGRHLADYFAGLHGEGDEVLSWTQDAEALNHAQAFPMLEYYLPYAVAQPVSLLDYAPPDALIVVDDLDELREALHQLAEDAENNRANNLKTGQIPPDYPTPYVTPQALEADLAGRRVLSLATLAEAERERLFTPGARYGGQLRMALTQIREQRQQGGRFVIVSQQSERLSDLWYQQDASSHLPQVSALEEPPEPASLVFVLGMLAEGWTLHHPQGDLHLVTEAELFNWSRPEPRRRKAAQRGARRLPESDYADWKEGDFVVHVDYGIGRFVGMQSRSVEGHAREYLLVEYEGTDRLFVPVDQADRLTRFVGPDEKPPTMSKLGKPAEWLKTKEKARRAAEEEARELLEIYARRAASAGHHYQPDTPWQHELEAGFTYVETEDQLRTLREIKRDMESGMPMDRLVCGDVGYGKTEVALRAAFKTVMDGKQVAVLVPTTVLADQHYRTFSRRMEGFPVRVEMLSRFRDKSAQDRITREISAGQVDILIGTHRILSEDVDLKNLGLVIIDEEQRFGVKHKEHFKKLRAQVDVLTLTATPIPRTLYMSLSGVRDISMIQTPPEDRLPVFTHVGPFDAKLARQAILRELDRGGQIFVIHNRVRTIEAVRERFEELVPEASIVVAHGQMSGRVLEGIIDAFSQGKYDILLATSILENGIDMPNVNTLIVDHAEWFGMGQLYQLRGRVGRSSQQAFAYFFHERGRGLTDEAYARLETLAEHTHLGSGFQIAVRDLELRGAGDILSTRQTGQVASVGLHLYTQLLQQAVRSLKGEATAEAVPTYARDRVVIDLPIPAYIPNDWLPEMALRLQLYRRIGSLQTAAEIETMHAELVDRFGPLPNAVEGLLYQIRVKLLAGALRCIGVVKPRQHILVKLPWLASVDREALAQELGEDIEVSRVAVEIPADELWQIRLVDVLEHLRQGMPESVGA